MDEYIEPHDEECNCTECREETDYTKAGHLRELPELLQHVSFTDIREFYEEGEYEYPWD